MKKFLVVLLSLGLLVAFGATASAADVKFSGSYYVVGVYENNVNLAGTNVGDTSRAFFYQRVRLQPVFQIAEGLSFTVRMDALEKQWGQTDWRTGTDDKTNSRRQMGVYSTATAFNPKIQENFEFERAYVTFQTAAGVFDVGYMSSGKWATDFGDNEDSRPRIKFTTRMGPLTFLALYEKTFEVDYSVQAGYAGKVDADNDNIALAAFYSFKGGDTGLLYKYTFNNSSRIAAAPFKTKIHTLAPYVKATFGPVYVEGEVMYSFGKVKAMEVGNDIDSESLGAYIMAKANIGPAYFGGLYLYSAGDDGSDPTKSKTGPRTTDMNPALILANDELQTWENKGAIQSGAYASYTSDKYNIHMIKVFGGVNPTAKSNVELAFIAAKADKAPAGYDSKNYGMEVDATASYKIYDNLTYMVGAAYLWTGDYFKGTTTNEVGNNYLLMNKLSLSF